MKNEEKIRLLGIIEDQKKKITGLDHLVKFLTTLASRTCEPLPTDHNYECGDSYASVRGD